MISHKSLYRNEIDGIRFFSIILVILYHTKTTNIFNSGYLGVDIFFVIRKLNFDHHLHQGGSGVAPTSPPPGPQ